MDTDDDTHTTILDTSYLLLTIDDATLSDTPVSTEDFIIAQNHDPACKDFTKPAGLPSSKLAYENLGFLVRTSKLDGYLQRVIPISTGAQDLYLSYYTNMCGHTGS